MTTMQWHMQSNTWTKIKTPDRMNNSVRCFCMRCKENLGSCLLTHNRIIDIIQLQKAYHIYDTV